MESFGETAYSRCVVWGGCQSTSLSRCAISCEKHVLVTTVCFNHVVVCQDSGHETSDLSLRRPLLLRSKVSPALLNKLHFTLGTVPSGILTYCSVKYAWCIHVCLGTKLHEIGIAIRWIRGRCYLTVKKETIERKRCSCQIVVLELNCQLRWLPLPPLLLDIYTKFTLYSFWSVNSFLQKYQLTIENILSTCAWYICCFA